MTQYTFSESLFETLFMNIVHKIFRKKKSEIKFFEKKSNQIKSNEIKYIKKREIFKN